MNDLGALISEHTNVRSRINFSDDMCLGRRPTKNQNLSWKRCLSIWSAMINLDFFCNFKLETILDILDRGEEVLGKRTSDDSLTRGR